MTKDDIRKILVPFDGSKFSKKAVLKAAIIAKKFDAHVSFLTVVPSGSNPTPSKILGILVDDKKAQKGFHQTVCGIRMELKLGLSKIVKDCNKENISAEYKILEGNTIEKIIQTAKKGKYDLIVMGSHGLTGLTKIIALGSVARAISEIAPCPVLLVRNNL